MNTEPPLELPSAGGTNTSSQVLQNESQVIRKAGRQAIRQFLESHTCFCVLRTSGKVVVFDTRIPMQLAFYALVEHGTLLANAESESMSSHTETHLYSFSANP